TLPSPKRSCSPSAVDVVDAGDHAETPSRVRLAVEMHPAVEEHAAVRVHDEIGGRRHPDAARLAREEVSQRPGLPSPGHRLEAHGHVRGRSTLTRGGKRARGGAWGDSRVASRW